VAYAGPKPADSDLKVLQDLVNKLVVEGRAVEVAEMDRKAAEAFYTKNPVNGQYIYEKKEPPASVESLTIVTIPEWTVSVSATKDFVANTKEVGGVEVVRFNHRESKQELEVCFEMRASPPGDSTAASSKAEASKPAAATPTLKADNVPDASNAIFEAFIEALKRTRSDVQLSPQDLESLKSVSSLKINVILTALKNSAYGAGFTSHLKK